MTADVFVVHEEPAFMMAEWKDVAIVVWGAQGRLPQVRHLEKFTDEFIARHPKGISAVHIIANAAALPDSETRAELNRLTDKYAPKMACLVTVVEGSGFWASAMQSFVTSFHWVTRRNFKVRIASTIAEGSAWLPALHSARTGTRIDGAELLQKVQSVRDRVKPI
jgi:hypothetical protein